MKNLDQRNQIIEHSLKLNSTNLSPLRSGNISLRAEQDNIQGYSNFDAVYEYFDEYFENL